MNIRNAVASDIPSLVEMGMKFRSSTEYSEHLSENQDCMIALADRLIANNWLILAESQGLVGMLGFVIHKHFISGETIAGEVFWWVEEGSRGKAGILLLREMELRARLAGAKYMQMIAPTDKVASFYQRIGYKFIESTYQRAL
jgi:hypothetical protein